MNISKILKNLGPGLLFAGAAVGVSHLIQSTRAGASFGFELVWIIVLVNVFKYPFFEIGQRYTNAMNESLIKGYQRLGNWAVWLFLLLNIIISVFTIAAVTFVASAIFNYLYYFFYGEVIPTDITSVIYIIFVVAILFIGKYSNYEKFVKYLIIALSCFTVISLIFAAAQGMHVNADFVPPEVLNQAGIGFLLALMGWMPAPLELSVWTSLWALENDKVSGSKKYFNDSLLDFNVGYIICIVLALCFLGLGAFVMYGTGEVFSDSPVLFSGQLLSLYSTSIGDWSKPIIAFIMFVTMFSTVITCADAYPRSIAESIITIKTHLNERFGNKIYWATLIIVNLFAALIVSLFTSSLTLFVDVVSIIAFLSSPIFALFNFLIIRKPFIPNEYKQPRWLKWLSYFGLFCFFAFAMLYLYSRLFMG